MKQGFLYLLFGTLLLALLLLSYVVGDTIAPSIDAVGWLFYVTSCLSHAAIVAVALWLVLFLPWQLLRLRRLAAVLIVAGMSLAAMLAFVNMQVYKIYRFHLNGFIFNMLTGPNAGDIFDFAPLMYLTEGALLMVILMVCVGGWWLCRRVAPRWTKRCTTVAIATLLAALLTANGLFVYGSFVVKPSVLKSARLVPYYFPLSATGFLEGLGLERHVMDISQDEGGQLCYPLQPLVTDTAMATRPNIVMILIDSWSRRALSPETMPNLWQLAHREQWYQNHVSCGNGTSFSVFGIFTGLQPYYWTAFESSRTSPLLIDQLLQLGYDVRTYPSASLDNPPFSRMIFQHVPHLRVSTAGDSSYERDLRIKADLIGDLPRLKAAGRPFFAFIFFDLLHAYSLPRELLKRFQPSWEYGKFDELHNDMDPTPFWNLYRNSAYQTDKMVSELIDALKKQGLYDQSLVVITGDHAQEYNENHKNYWGHNSNFTKYQIGVPLIVHEPGNDAAAVYSHRTTHLDFVPTLMHNYLGVTNPVGDYSNGHLLGDTVPRQWHYAGNELRYAFIVEGDTILTKEGAGYIEVTDSSLNPVPDYQIKPREFDDAIRRLNRFLK